MPPSRFDPAPLVRTGWITIALIFGLAGGYSAIASVEGAVVADGTVIIEGRRQAIQHLDGGIIRHIATKDGDHVKKGDVIIRLDTTATDAILEATGYQLAAYRALEARLLAERNGSAEPDFPTGHQSGSQGPSAIIRDQMTQFHERASSKAGRITLAKARMEQATQQLTGFEEQLEAAKRQQAITLDELEGVRTLASRNLVSRARLSSLQRESARLKGTQGRAMANIHKARSAIASSQLEIAEIEHSFMEEVDAFLIKTREAIARLDAKHRAASAARIRSDIVAPLDGTIHNQTVHTSGAVIKADQIILELVPDTDRIAIEARLDPSDIDRVHVGQEAQIRISAENVATRTHMTANVKFVSSDRILDEKTGQPFYSAELEIDQQDAQLLRPGMHAEIMFMTERRSLIKYLTTPLVAALATAHSAPP